MFSSMSSDEILKIVGGWDALRLGSPEEVLHYRIRVVPEANFDRTFESMDISVVTGSLVCLMFSHERN
jgi:hypothetical protein